MSLCSEIGQTDVPLTAAAMTLTSIIIPRWISWDNTTVRLFRTETAMLSHKG